MTSDTGIRCPRPPLQTAWLYLVFVVISIAANLASQELVYRLMPRWRLHASILAGTIVGFGVKYLLDKHYIFQDVTTTRTAEVRKIFQYGLFSVFTTLVFWAFEFTFFHVWQTTFAKYLGAVIGLGIGYVIKFYLDNRYTFAAVRATP